MRLSSHVGVFVLCSMAIFYVHGCRRDFKNPHIYSQNGGAGTFVLVACVAFTEAAEGGGGGVADNLLYG